MSQTPLTLRYNNPGAVEFKPWMSKYGASVGPNGRYAAFPSPDQGYQVMSRILDTYAKRGQNSVSSIIGGLPNNPNLAWAPRSVDNNSTDTYIQKVASRLGVDPNQPLGADQRQALMEAMAAYEAGTAPAPVGGGQMRDYRWDEALPPEGGMSAPMGLGAGGVQPQPQPAAPTFLDMLNRGFASPLTQQGLGLFLAASQGKDLNAGMSAGTQRAASTQRQMMLDEEKKRALAQRAAMQQMLANSQHMEGIPPVLAEIARATGDAGPIQSFVLARAKARAAQQAQGDPSNIREWERFQQMTPEQQRAYLTMKRAGKVVDTETGFATVDPLDPSKTQGVVKKDIAGKELEVARGKFLVAQPKLEMNLQALASQNKMAKQEIASALDDIKGGGVTSWAGLYANYVPGTAAFALSRKLLTLKALVGLDKLGEMRDSSATGASGLGALSEKEMELLTSVFGSLDQKQDAATLERNLRRVQELMEGREERMREAFGKDLARFGMKAQPRQEQKRLRFNPATGELE